MQGVGRDDVADVHVDDVLVILVLEIGNRRKMILFDLPRRGRDARIAYLRSVLLLYDSFLQIKRHFIQPLIPIQVPLCI